MEIFMDKCKEIVDFASDDKPIAVADAINELMKEKMLPYLDQTRLDVAQKLFVGKE